jgi:tetratricopeptide (TPR) repeat protein
MKEELTSPRESLFTKSLICLLLSSAVLIVYWQLTGFEFVNFDDPKYVIGNPTIKQGITLQGIRWAFVSVYASNWHPLSWISHMLDIQFFGMNPGMHHLTNVILHIINALMLFLILEKMTGALWRSAITAALFALHPLHVESVAWISERKDVLSIFFWMCTLMAYLWYVKGRSIQRYLIVVILYILGLLSKPMLVTLPFLLLVLDFWPLKRFKIRETTDSSNPQEKQYVLLPQVLLLCLEKLPLLIIAVISSGMTIYAQRSGGALRPFEILSMTTRIENALVSYVAYLGKMIWPLNLAVFYPYPDTLSPYIVILSCILLLMVTVLVLFNAIRLPYLAVGWFWYLGTLIPVIGILQVGSQSMADRYTYIPLVGIFIMIVWGFQEALHRHSRGKTIFCVASVSVCTLLMYVSWIQTSFWKDSETLFTHAINVTSRNELAYYNLGKAFEDKGDKDGAIGNYEKALQIEPNDPDSHSSLATLLGEKGLFREATTHFNTALRINPRSIETMVNLANVLLRTGNTDSAIFYYKNALRMDPWNAEIYNNLGTAYVYGGELKTGAELFQKALRIRPKYEDAAENLMKAQAALTKIENAIVKLEEFIKADPRNPDLYTKMAGLRRQQGDMDQAIADYKKALEINPESVQALYGLVMIFSSRLEFSNALEKINIIRKIQPDNPNVYYDTACIYAKMNMPDKSVLWLKQAIDKGFHNISMISNDPDLAIIRNTAYVKGLLNQESH